MKQPATRKLGRLSWPSRPRPRATAGSGCGQGGIDLIHTIDPISLPMTWYLT
jgi:hypothetical protein